MKHGDGVKDLAYEVEDLSAIVKVISNYNYSIILLYIGYLER